MTAISDLYEVFNDLESAVERVCEDADVSPNLVWLLLKHRAELKLNELKENNLDGTNGQADD